VAVTAASGCGGSGKHASAAAVTVLMARPPSSLGPAVGSGAEATEADWLVYTPPLTYAHAPGVTGTRLIPAVLGYPIVRILFSGRIDAGDAIYQPAVGLDRSSLALR
jgi:hypothetical protein